MTEDILRMAPRASALVAVKYVGFDWDCMAMTADGFDSVTMAVCFQFENCEPYVLRWMVRQSWECLTTVAPVGRVESPLQRVIDVTWRWQPMVGSSVVGQSVVSQTTEWGAQPWSTRLDFATGVSLVVCLGDLTAEGDPMPSVDALLVTRNRELARRYRPISALGNAWGD